MPSKRENKSSLHSKSKLALMPKYLSMTRSTPMNQHSDSATPHLAQQPNSPLPTFFRCLPSFATSKVPPLVPAPIKCFPWSESGDWRNWFKMGKDGHDQLTAPPLGDLDDLLSKLSTWDGSSGATATHDDPTSSTAQEVLENGQTSVLVPGESHLEMKEIEPQDIDVILRLSSADSSSLAEGRKGGTEASSSTSELSSTGEAGGGGDEVVESSHVWYACYGSNMWKKRFMCYIEGGKVEGMARSCIGCRDKSPPVASEWLSIPNRLFFGHESTRTWGLGGVAFLNPVSEAGVLSHIRIYKITMEQFNDVLSQENPGRAEKNWMSGKHISELKTREPHHLMDIFGEHSWYGTVKYLGEKDGLPILTFTCPESHMEKFRSGEFGTFGPPDSYRNVILRGLVEDLRCTEQEAHEYLSSAILPKEGQKEGSQGSPRNHYY